LHAWNVEFFKLCVFDCGRFLRADSCSADKDKLDFARVLIATSDLDIVTKDVRILVDGVQVVIKIVEEWGYAMGKDTCLFEEENESEASQTDCDEGLVEPDVHRHVDLMVDDLAKEVTGKDNFDSPGYRDVEIPHKTVDTPSDADDSDAEDEGTEEIYSTPRDQGEVQPPPGLDLPGANKNHSSMPGAAPHIHEPHDSPMARLSTGPGGPRGGVVARCVRASSCPPTENRHALKGPWSWEWLADHNHGEAGVIFSASKRAKKGGPPDLNKKGMGQPVTSSKKAEGVLRHPVHSLKKVARLPSKDRAEVLKVLGKCVRRRRAGAQGEQAPSADRKTSSESPPSLGSNTNDWKNWVAVHGDERMAADDVRGIGNSIGVSFHGVTENMFTVLSRTGNGKNEVLGEQQGKGVQKEKGC
jgi:hypothetical protein